MPNTQSKNSKVPQSVPQNRLQVVQTNVGQEIPPVAEVQNVESSESTQAIVPTTESLARIRPSSAAGGAKNVGWLDPRISGALAIRNATVEIEHTPPSTLAAQADLPTEVVEKAQQWLRSKNLVWSATDPAFWRALSYVLSTLETFSIDAVEQALIICTTEASSDVARRAAIYQELRAVRALKKVRDLSLKVRTAQVIAERALVPSQYFAELEARERRAQWEADAPQREADAEAANDLFTFVEKAIWAANGKHTFSANLLPKKLGELDAIKTDFATGQINQNEAEKRLWKLWESLDPAETAAYRKLQKEKERVAREWKKEDERVKRITKNVR